METDALWRRVIEAKYENVWGGWCTKKVSSAYGVSLWRFIRSGWLNFSKLLRYDVGEFWKHVWCGDCTLQEAFLELYCISRARESLEVEVICWSDGRFHMDVQFCHPSQDWEREVFDLFINMVYSSTVWGIGLDQFCWKLARNSGFAVRGFYLSFYPPTLLSFHFLEE